MSILMNEFISLSNPYESVQEEISFLDNEEWFFV